MKTHTSYVILKKLVAYDDMDTEYAVHFKVNIHKRPLKPSYSLAIIFLDFVTRGFPFTSSAHVL